jgi:tetraacyldisaccharide-1-P 4'-kinase
VKADGFHLVTGIENGAAAAASAREAGYAIVEHTEFSDHHPYRADEVRGLLANARQAGYRIALTGKDWVKWRDLGVARSEVEVLEPEVVLDDAAWNRIVWGE